MWRRAAQALVLLCALAVGLVLAIVLLVRPIVPGAPSPGRTFTPVLPPTAR